MNKKELILDAAIELFATHGFEKTSISAICERTKVSKGLVFHHFKNKNELLRKVFMRMDHIISEVNSSIDHSLPAKQRLTQLIENIFAAMAIEKHLPFYRLNYQVITQPAIRSILIDLIEDRTKMMLDMLESIFNEIPGADAFVSSRTIVAEIDGIALNYVFASDSFPLDDIKNSFINKHLSLL